MWIHLLYLFTFLLMYRGAHGHVTCHLSEELNLCESSESNTGENAKRVIVGPPGKQGPRGPPGDVLNCNCATFDDMQAKIEQLEETVLALKRSSLCKGVVHENTCIRLLKTIYDPIDYSTSSELCSFHGGHLADIDNSDVYTKVFKYIQNEWNDYKSSKKDYAHVWLGMKYINNAIVTTRGHTVDPDNVGKWYPNHPNGPVYMALVVPMDNTRVPSGGYGFTTVPASHTDVVPLCQFPLEQ